MPDPVFTIIAPIYNELENLPLLYERVRQEMEKTGEAWELILVDDGSKDGSTEVIRQLADKDERVRPVIFARNFGHQIAVTAGMDYSRGQATIIIDADLQDPPEVIHEMIARWREGWQVVYAVRSEREGESWFKKTTASVFYRLINKITDVDIPLDTGDFRLLDRQVLDVLSSMREKQRFLRGMSAWAGFRQTGVQYRRAARHAGTTHYPLKKMLKLAMNAVTGFSMWPMQMLTRIGAVFAALSGIIFVLLALISIFTRLSLTWSMAAFFAVFFIGGIILVGLGVLGEYLGRIFEQVIDRPLYIVAEGPAKGFDPTDLRSAKNLP